MVSVWAPYAASCRSHPALDQNTVRNEQRIFFVNRWAHQIMSVEFECSCAEIFGAWLAV